MSSETSESQANFTIQDSVVTCKNSSNGLLCLQNYKYRNQIYVCNPILGEYVTIPIGNTKTMHSVVSVLGFSSRSNQFKVLQINSPKNIVPYLARLYTIGDGTRQWKSVEIAPSCLYFSAGAFLNGSIHWIEGDTHKIVYFNFDSEQFGSLPSPPVRRDGRMYATMGVLDGCLFFYAEENGFWIMKEYGVEESWTKVSSVCMFGLKEPSSSSLYNDLLLLYENCKIQLEDHGATYNPSLISLQDVAKGEQLTVIS